MLRLLEVQRPIGIQIAANCSLQTRSDIVKLSQSGLKMFCTKKSFQKASEGEAKTCNDMVAALTVPSPSFVSISLRFLKRLK